MKESDSKELLSAETQESSGRGRRKEIAKITPHPVFMPGQDFLPKGRPLPLGGRRRAQTHYRVTVRLSEEAPIHLKDVIGELEKKVIVQVLSDVDGNQKNAAKILGMKYTTLNEKVKRYHIKVRKISVIE